MYDLSVVIPTCDRADSLRACLAAVRDTAACEYELVVVDGASGDHTPGVLEWARGEFGDRLKVIHEGRREGFVKAANKGFRAATGRNLMWLNDDARPLPGALDAAVRQIDAAGIGVGFLALFHHWHSERNVAYETRLGGQVYRLCHVRGTLYANFAVGRRATFDRLGYFDERFTLCGADPDLSLKAWHAGLRVEPAYGAVLDHDESDDDRRAGESPRRASDNDALFAKWDLPPKNPNRNDFDPTRPCTLRGLRSPIAA